MEPTVPPPEPPDSPDAWYAPGVHDQYALGSGVVATVRSGAGGFRYEVREPSLSAPDGLSFVLQTRDELRARGAFHPTLHVRSLDAVPLAVGGDGLELKENARVSTLLVP